MREAVELLLGNGSVVRMVLSIEEGKLSESRVYAIGSVLARAGLL